MFDPIAYLNEPRWRAARLGLDRIAELLERLGNPQDSLRFVHVAGTNGKGSTCAYVASVLQAAGYRTGLFTSPYIERFEERIRVNGATISPEELLRDTLAVREQAEIMADHPTEFELMCAVALLHFARERCEIVVLEVGLGGRYDATNVIGTAEVSVIARIGLDHTAVLGDTIGAIAGEKAGIVKPGVPVVSWPQEPEAAQPIADAAARCGVTVRTPDFSQLEIFPATWENDAEASEGVDGAGDAPATPAEPAVARAFSYKRYSNLTTRLIARYQPANAALAIETVEVLREQGWSISDDALREGIARARWIGRFEVAGERPMRIVDGGHNPQGARALAESLRDVFPGMRCAFVMGALADKDYRTMLAEVVPLAQAFVCITPDNPRALSAEDLAAAASEALRSHLDSCTAVSGSSDRPADAVGVPVLVADDADDAVRIAGRLAGADGVICAFGSLYSVARMRRALIGYNSQS